MLVAFQGEPGAYSEAAALKYAPGASVLPCPGFLKLGDIKFHCWLGGGHGGLNVQGAITASCNCFFYEAARRT